MTKDILFIETASMRLAHVPILGRQAAPAASEFAAALYN
jgi:hypothetical protein